jgi:PAS domain S-box-containing protein
MQAPKKHTASQTDQDPAGAHHAEGDALGRQSDYMHALQDIMLAVANRVDPLEVLDILLKNTLQLMQTDHGFYFQYEADTDKLVLTVGFGYYRPETEVTIQMGDGLVGKIWQNQTAIIVNDYQAWPGRHPDTVWDVVFSAAGAPVLSRGTLLGIIGILHTEKGRQIADHEFELLKRFADLAAIALDKARVDAKLEAELRERRQAEAALVESEERYRTVVEDLSEFILRWRPDGHVLFANEAYCRYKGEAKAQIIGGNVADLFTPQAFEQAKQIIARLAPDHPLEPSEIFKLDPENQPKWEEWTDRGIFDEAGRLIEIQSVGRNITIRKLAEKALQKSENRFHSFFNSNPEGIILVDLEGNILDANRSLLKMTGYLLDEIQGKAYQSLVAPRYYPQVARNFAAMLEGLVRDDTLEIEYVDKTGDSIPVEVRGWIITDEKSQPVAIGGFIRDITRERLLAADKAALEGQLQQTQKMEAIGTLAGGIAHDFNNILSGILGYAELALGEADDSKTALMHYLTGVLDACRRARDLVQQILKFSRRDDSTRMPLSLSPLLKEAVKLLRSTLPATIRVKENITAELDTVVADATQLHQVIMNLGANAYHAMRETGGTLTFSLQNRMLTEPKYFLTLTIPPGEYVKLSIADTGPGIPDKMRERIFEPYFTTKEKQEGTGLGLSVTFGIIKNLNGLIEVEQSDAGATTFAVYLPIGKKAGVRAPSRAHRLPRGRDERILCVDDENIFLEVVQKHLEGLGYQVKSCPSSVQALEYLQANPAAFDLIITDQTMPEMTGVQLAADIREINKTIPLILCTGYSEAVTAQTAKRLGIASILMKPITRSELARTVDRVLRDKKS